MAWYFEDLTNSEQLIDEINSWSGTPFGFYARAKGQYGGIDCLGFCEEVTAGAGLERWAFERSMEDYSKHVLNDTIANHLRGLVDSDESRALAARWAEFAVIDQKFSEPPMLGDLVLYKDESAVTKLAVFHMGIMISPLIFAQCAPRLGVCEGQIDDPTYGDRLNAHFRARLLPLEPEV